MKKVFIVLLSLISLSGCSTHETPEPEIYFPPIPEIAKYNISFYDNIGTLLSTKIVEENQQPKCDFDAPEGYDFLGWSNTKNGELLDKIPLATADCEYYAICKSKKAKIIVMAGQSNMEGHDALHNSLDSTVKKYYCGGTSNVKIKYNCYYANNTSHGAFVNVNFGYGKNISLFGPEVGFAKQLSLNDAYSEYYLVKSCKGSSALVETAAHKDYSYAASGDCYANLVKDVEDAITYLTGQEKDFEISGLIWMQGCTEACSGVYDTVYANETLKLIERFETKFSNYIPANGISFIDGGISTSGWPTYATGINNAKKSVAETNDKYIYVADSETLSKVNSYHYSAESYLTLGEKFASNFLLADAIK